MANWAGLDLLDPASRTAMVRPWLRQLLVYAFPSDAYRGLTIGPARTSPFAPSPRSVDPADDHTLSWPMRRRLYGPTTWKRLGCRRRIQCTWSQKGGEDRGG